MVDLVDPATQHGWSPGSWRQHPVEQQPEWPDLAELQSVERRLGGLPPLVYPGEIRSLTRALGDVAEGRAFLLQAGDCAESFTDFSTDGIRARLRVILQMAVILTYAAGVPVVKVGRIAGQYAKPRSSATETIDGVTMSSFRGHIVHGDAPDAASRKPDPARLVRAYEQSSTTLNILRSLAAGGFADLSQVHAWNQEFVGASPEGQRYEQLAREIEDAVRFMRACGIDLDHEATLSQVDFWTSHEALLLGYEEALCRRDPVSDAWFATSAAMLWVGERTRRLDSGHLEFVRGVTNPIGVKLGPTATPDDVSALATLLNPDRIPGRLTLIARMGASKVATTLPPLLDAVRATRIPVVWASDPMHGNTFTTDSGRKTRHLDSIVSEVAGFFSACRETGTHPGGMHVELTGDNVTECLGGGDALADADLELNYATTCDPRLNAKQAIDLAFAVADLLRHQSR